MITRIKNRTSEALRAAARFIVLASDFPPWDLRWWRVTFRDIYIYNL
jgi:hypothetical protein